MIRGNAFYAIWDDDAQTWRTDEYFVQLLIDRELSKYAQKYTDSPHIPTKIMYACNFGNGIWTRYKNYVKSLSDNYIQLDEDITYKSDITTKESYRANRLTYDIAPGSIDAYDQLMSVLYLPEERQKLEWAIGSIFSGDSKNIQKFIVIYGDGGTGKSTVINLIVKLFEGYYSTFDAKSIGSNSNQFAVSAFKSNPLVAIQHDGDLSKIEDNTKLNSIIAHEEMLINEKHKAYYTTKINAFLFMGTNKPVKITDAKSGLNRRLIDVSPTGKKLAPSVYFNTIAKIGFELGAIAHHCLSVYQRLGRHYYEGYRPLSMIMKTDVFYNFVEDNYFIFAEQDGIDLQRAYAMYKTYCEDTLIDHKLPKYKFGDELKNYFKEFLSETRINGKHIRGYYRGFLKEKFNQYKPIEEVEEPQLVLEETISILDKLLKDCPAQYTTRKETPIVAWENVNTTLKDIDSSKLHYVRPPQNHIVIDFDIRNDSGEKDINLNLRKAAQWPITYAELSKGGNGVHLHYIYDGDVTKLCPIHEPGVEVKVFTGLSSLRRRVSLCNAIPVATLATGLKTKEDKVIDFKSVYNEKALRTVVENNLKKQYHPSTRCSIDYIYKALEDAYNSGMAYDLSDMRQSVLIFAMNSTNQAATCLDIFSNMKFVGKQECLDITEEQNTAESDGPIVFYDVEVYPNLLVICWKMQGTDVVNSLVNPDPSLIQDFFKYRLIGYNCRRYDNHIMYGRYLGYSNEELFALSQRIINNTNGAFFKEAYGISYADIYEYINKKQRLKQWEIDLKISHMEMDIPWDQPVTEEDVEQIVSYCKNDVIATEAVFNATQADYEARLILSKLSGRPVNDSTRVHAETFLFGSDRNPQSQFVFKDLSEIYPGYKFDAGKGTYLGEEINMGGYVYAEPGMYEDVVYLDIKSMHPHSIINLNLFGDVYTKRYKSLVDVRIAVKEGRFDDATKLFDGKLKPYLNDKHKDGLADALKLVINIIYGLTFATHPNRFTDDRNIDNIVAKAGALFMVTLKQTLQAMGHKVIHIKTDSIKIANADQSVINFVMDFGKKYGYNFGVECTYGKMCLVNDAVYIARKRNENGFLGDWDAVGAQFAHPYVFKTLFSKEKLTFDDFCETKSVYVGDMYLDMNENMGEDEHNYVFVGRCNSFVPIKDGYGGGILYRKKDDKYHAVQGTKGYRWLNSNILEQRGDTERDKAIDIRYFDELCKDAKDSISNYGDFDWLVDDFELPF